ncbi:RNA polymerase II C-terminal domain phosphatase-like 3 isoform X2 [Phalaenopsis equestris]|uniref:RNA polymerase II C-terminal domain phosphatase-like 3 isoform X2 n=1 Tax=Phalaenopsis equestris TaxID=78828 RepID=UPI0009E45501|nr:RNA polymerase II C-terminal domain phosphatase-like 3 isoform X2 [Phalaenopsis equestris]
MRMPRSSRFVLNPSEKKTLARMARNGSHVNGVDNGEISDGDSSASLEEISAEDFRQDGRGSRSRVWDDGMMGYSVARTFGPTLYSFAWAQAVQNKPLGLEMKRANDADGKRGKEGGFDAVFVDSSEDSVGEMEKEEGELEEGEIDLDYEPVAEEMINLSSDKIEDDSKLPAADTKENEDKEEADMEDLDRRVAEILEELEAITSEEAEASLEAACSRLLKSFAGLKTLFAESHVPILDALVQHAFMGIQTLNSVFCSGNVKKTKQNMDLLLRLLIHIKNQYSLLLTQDQVTEIDSMAQLLLSSDVSKEKVLQSGSSANSSDSSHQPERPSASFIASAQKPDLGLRETDLSGSHSRGFFLPKFQLPLTRSRVEFSPLLDLHADYEEGSLPSPTRDNAPPLPIMKPVGLATSVLSHPTVFKKEEKDDTPLHSYMNDAVKAVSSYQQKYGRTSILPSNELPSPTPSEECSNEDEKLDEISSSLVVGSVKSAEGSSLLKTSGSGSSFVPTAPNKMAGQLNSLQTQVAKAKSRDPRLRVINPNIGVSSDQDLSRTGRIEGITNDKKHKAADAIRQEDHPLKRQRYSSITLTDMPMNVSRVVPEMINKPGNATASAAADSRPGTNGNSIDANPGNDQNPAISSVPSISLPSLLKEMDISPEILMELLKIKQQSLAAESQQKAGISAGTAVRLNGSSGLPGSISSVNDVALKTKEVEQNSSSKPQISAQSATSNDAGRLRMKPRDPRRILHDNVIQKPDGSVPEQNKIGPMPSSSQTNKDKITDRDMGEQSQIPNYNQQFTKNLKNVADNMSSKLTIIASTSGPPDISQPFLGMANRSDGRIIMESNDSKVGNGSSSQTGTRDASQAANPWGDVDHLLSGYDDQQKAVIQKERTRRIAEQNKMFAARKLCLVLDLDHTLLNSAKFGEVEQVHEEILRKKEEQDREQLQRHLFRFQHMAMWTKLRPGVWNFLEKASKIFELHLYTMGNKLYATEMAKVLDPTGTLFAGRVISRGDDGEPFDGDERVPKSKDLDGVLGLESAVVIIDDSVRVWPHNRHNLIVVERYTYFPCSRRQFGLLGPSLLEIDHDERPEDGTLASCLAVIEKIHQIFFSHNCLNDVDVRHILATEQRKILAGCKIVFSRIFPVGEANPHFHPLWQTAEQFGGICTNQIDEQVTHVVANSLGTDKVNWALSTGRFVVHPGWVEASALLYRRANENDFAVKL